MEWEELLLSYETAANTKGLHCNWQKTKVQNVGAGPAPLPVQMENQLVESATKFTYLGSDVVSGSSSTHEVHRRIGLANSIVGQLDRVWRNRRLSLNTKLRLYTSVVQSVLLHGSETWTLTKADTARLQAFHMKAQRRIRNIKWYDFVTNDSVRSQTKLTDLPHIIADRRHSLLGHVCRLPPDVPAHNIPQHCVNLSQGRCPSPTGSVHLVGQGRHGYNRWKRITGAQSTRYGHRRMIARCGGRYDPRWSSAAVRVSALLG